MRKRERNGREVEEGGGVPQPCWNRRRSTMVFADSGEKSLGLAAVFPVGMKRDW
jgi:hypothetical protein